MSRYTWIVTRDSVIGDSSDAVGKLGPPGAADRERFDTVIIHGEHFRMLNANGETQFSGYIIGEFDGSEPLDDYGAENGCVRIEFERDGRWMSLESFMGSHLPQSPRSPDSADD